MKSNIWTHPDFPVFPDRLFVIVNKNFNFVYSIAFAFYIYSDCLQNMREYDRNIILRKHREVQRYSFQNISTQVNKFKIFNPNNIFPCARAFPMQ